MDSQAKRRQLLDLILEVSFRRERVTLASGRESDFYLDLRQTLMRPRGVALSTVISTAAPGRPSWKSCLFGLQPIEPARR